MSAFVAQAAAVPGSAEEREGLLAGVTHTEVYPLTLFAVGGMLLFPAANDLLTMFVALEVLSLPLYLLCGLARRRRLLSQEAAMKYFLLGAFSSAFFLFGVAMLYGYSGSVGLSAIAAAASSNVASSTLLYAGIALLGIGLLFKIGAVPFQAWKPDVYQGAPTPVTALMASCTVVAAFGALLRVFYVRSAAHLGLAARDVGGGHPHHGRRRDHRDHPDRRQATACLLVDRARRVHPDRRRRRDHRWGCPVPVLPGRYGFTTIGAFAVVTLVRDETGEAAHLRRWAGLGKRSPLVAGIFAFFLLAFAGIPLTSGFTGKFAVFQAAIAGGALPLVIVGVLSSAVAAFFYVRVIVLMFFSDPAPDGPSVVTPGLFTGAAVAIGAVTTLVFGVVPGPLLNLANHAANHMFVR